MFFFTKPIPIGAETHNHYSAPTCLPVFAVKNTAVSLFNIYFTSLIDDKTKVALENQHGPAQQW